MTFSGILKIRMRGRLILGFSAVCAVLVVAVGYTVYVVSGVSVTVNRMVELRTPVAVQSTQLVGNLYSTLATLRGYLLAGNPRGKDDRAAMWTELDRTRATLDKMAEQFTDPENKRKWAEVKGLIDQFRGVQDRVEAIAFTPDAYPATKLLLERGRASRQHDVRRPHQHDQRGRDPRGDAGAQAVSQDHGGCARQSCRRGRANPDVSLVRRQEQQGSVRRSSGNPSSRRSPR